MGGASMGDGDEPVQVNVTPLIDVIFCLCLFFMCSFHFKQLEGKLDSWLPKDKGNQAGGAVTATLDEMRIFIRLNPSSQATEMQFGARPVPTLDELENLIVQGYRDCEAGGKKKGTVIIDGEPRVPWKDVLSVLDRSKLDAEKKAKNGISKDFEESVEFAQPMPGTPANPKPS